MDCCDLLVAVSDHQWQCCSCVVSFAVLRGCGMRLVCVPLPQSAMAGDQGEGGKDTGSGRPLPVIGGRKSISGLTKRETCSTFLQVSLIIDAPDRNCSLVDIMDIKLHLNDDRYKADKK